MLSRSCGPDADGDPKLGKTATQKLVYLTQELEGVPIDYRFRFYYYGPYSSDLAGDLEYLNTLQGVKITYDPFVNMYHIRSGEKTNVLIEKAQEFVSQYEEKIERIVRTFGGKRADELELIATIVYVWKSAQGEGIKDEKQLIDQVAELKPKFNAQEIQTALEHLKVNGYLE
jgi:uncharacterized protein YwgA